VAGYNVRMNRIKLPLAILALSACVALAVAFASGRDTASTPKTPKTPAAPARVSAPRAALSAGTDLQNAFVAVYRKVSPSVVQIETSEGLGSGIVFDGKGDIVTNFHVVGSSKTFTVTTSTGKQLKGTLVGSFPADDLAVIRVAAGANLRPAAFANSSKLRVGDIAMAIGNPLGLQSSVTQGIVSALGRQESEGNGFTLQNAIQTSAAINPGNSGGALVDIVGRVIGIPTLAAADPQLGGAASGIGFAIPSNTVKSIATQLVRHGHVVSSGRPYLGVEIGDTGNGVYVGKVNAGGPAAKAGLKAGDVIVALNGKPTPTSDELGTLLAAFKPGQTVTLKVVHQSGSTDEVKVKLGQYPGTA
jgi:putative serine protease PepD